MLNVKAQIEKGNCKSFISKCNNDFLNIDIVFSSDGKKSSCNVLILSFYSRYTLIDSVIFTELLESTSNNDPIIKLSKEIFNKNQSTDSLDSSNSNFIVPIEFLSFASYLSEYYNIKIEESKASITPEIDNELAMELEVFVKNLTLIEQINQKNYYGQIDSAINLASNFLKEYPNNVYINKLLGELYFLNFDSKKSIYYFLNANSIKLESSNFVGIADNHLYILLDGDSARNYYVKALELDDSNSKAFLGLSATYLRSEDSSTALDYLKWCLLKAPYCIECKLEIVRIHLLFQDYDSALENINEIRSENRIYYRDYYIYWYVIHEKNKNLIKANLYYKDFCQMFDSLSDRDFFLKSAASFGSMVPKD